MKSICVIPARMGSSRFPGKPLEKACGIPLILHVAKRCMASSLLDEVWVATCDSEIAECCRESKVNVVMTGKHHERCTDRVCEAIGNKRFNVDNKDLILMVQGDEILTDPDMIELVIKEYRRSTAPVINLLSRIYRLEDLEDPNVVKVVFSPEKEALYFSRAPIPSTYRAPDAVGYQQTGVIGFSKEFLEKYSKMPQTPLENIESIDMLRVIENHLSIKIVTTEKETIAVDTPDDLVRAVEVLKSDHLHEIYGGS